jgi:DNA-binding beta-propeller fold protein YncE
MNRIAGLAGPGNGGSGRRLSAALCLLLMGALLAGCGAAKSVAPRPALKAAEPAHDARAAAHLAGHSVKVGGDPQGIAVASGAGLVAVGVHSPKVAIVVLSARTGRVVKQVTVAGAPRHLAVAGPDGPVLVPEERDNELAEVSLSTGHVRSYRTGDFPHAVEAYEGRVFVGNERGGSLSEILPSGQVRTFRGFTQPGGLAGVDGDLAVVDVATFTLSLVNPADGAIIGRLPAGQGPTHDIADAGRIYVLDTRGDAVLTFTAKPFREVGRTPLAGAAPYGVALDPVHHRLWVTETAKNQVAELSLSGRLPRLIRTYATGLQPDTVAVDSVTGRVFVANQISGTVQTIDPSG